ncbi:hypothetical protein [Pedococcus bigeumensis]|uniref:hypothetical protein n=1 Tax=Pedococcus bigeumensis TaxID=433644 RepID=UPI0031DAC3C5
MILASASGTVGRLPLIGWAVVVVKNEWDDGDLVVHTAVEPVAVKDGRSVVMTGAKVRTHV